MNAAETGKLLASMALYDNRKIGDLDVIAWLKVIGDLAYADAEQAVVAHYTETTERIMPADIRQRVKSIRSQRIAHALIPPPPPELADNPQAYRAQLAENIRKAADGQLPPPLGEPLAIGPPPGQRHGGPPESLRSAITDLRRQLGPPAPAREIKGPEEIAAEQAAEARTKAERNQISEEAS